MGDVPIYTGEAPYKTIENKFLIRKVKRLFPAATKRSLSIFRDHFELK
jgi:hypothetical protein